MGYFYNISALIVYTHIKINKNGIVMNKMTLGCETLHYLIIKNNYDVAKAIDKFKLYEKLIGNKSHITNNQLKTYLITILCEEIKQNRFRYN